MTEINPKPIVLTSQEGATQIITLNRPEKSNALHPDLIMIHVRQIVRGGFRRDK